jgi:hypothetical protein
MPIPLGVLAVAGAGAAGGGGSFDLLQTTLISTNTASITFSSLNTLAAGYAHLQIRITSRTSQNSGTDALALQINGDTGSNYAWHRLNGNGSTVASGAVTSQARIHAGSTTGNLATANIFGASVIDLLDFGSSSKNKTIRTLNGVSMPDTPDIRLGSGVWLNTNAATSVTLFSLNGASFVSGSRLSLYGIR